MLRLRNGKYKTTIVKNEFNRFFKCSNSSTLFALQRPYSQLLKNLSAVQTDRTINHAIRVASTIESLKVKKPQGKYANVVLPSEIKVVICGGGVMGAAVAYHLALAGHGEQTIILEQCR